MPSAGRLFVIIHNVGLAGYVHIIGHIGVWFNKTMSLLGFDTLFKPIIIAYLLVYVNIVILKPHFT